MFVGQSFPQQCIANRPRKRNIDDTAVVHMPDLRISETKLACTKLMWVHGDLRPRYNDVLEILQMHKLPSAHPLDARYVRAIHTRGESAQHSLYFRREPSADPPRNLFLHGRQIGRAHV